MDYFESFGINIDKGKYHEEAIYSIALLYNLFDDKISAYLKDFDLSIGKLNVLVSIRHQGGEKGISQVDISKHLIVSPANMTKLLDKLEEEGLVYRQAHKDDRRVNMIKISPKGIQLLDRLWPGYQKELEGLASRLMRQEQKTLSALLRKWVGLLVNN